MKQFGFCEKIVKNLKILTFFAVSGSACCIETWLELKSITSRKVLSFLVLFLSPAMQAELQYSQFPLSASTLLHFIAATTKLVSIPNLTRMTAMAKEGTKAVQPCWLRWQRGWTGHLSQNYSPWDSTFQLEKNPSPFFKGAFLRWHPRITTLISSHSGEGAGRLGRGNRNSALGLSVGLGGRWRVTPGPRSAPSTVTHTKLGESRNVATPHAVRTAGYLSLGPQL